MAMVGAFHQGEKPIEEEEFEWILALKPTVES